MNKIIITGNLTRDPELRTTPSGVAVCSMAVAVQRDFADSDGNRAVDFFNVNVWREKGETCAKHLKKGRKVGIVGSLQNRSYEDKDGVKRTVTEIIASEVEFLSPKQEEPAEETVELSVKRERPQLEEINDNELPF